MHAYAQRLFGQIPVKCAIDDCFDLDRSELQLARQNIGRDISHERFGSCLNRFRQTRAEEPHFSKRCFVRLRIFVASVLASIAAFRFAGVRRIDVRFRPARNAVAEQR